MCTVLLPPGVNPIAVNKYIVSLTCRSQWPRGLRRKSAAARPLRLWVRIPPHLAHGPKIRAWLRRLEVRMRCDSGKSGGSGNGSVDVSGSDR